jgi:hypothetical protein
MSDTSFISFDKFCPLVSSGDKSGYRISTTQVPYTELLNFLCDNYGEGDYIYGAIENEVYSIRKTQYEIPQNKTVILIYGTIDIVYNIFDHFKIDIPFDNSNTIEYIVINAITPLLFSKTTNKRIRKLKQLIVNALRYNKYKLQWYDIHYNEYHSTIYFTMDDTLFTIRL